MPVQIQMGKPADLAGIYLEGKRTQAQIAEARQRLSQQQSEVTARLQADAARQAQEHDVEQQRIKVAESYHQQETALKTRQLDEVAAVNAQKTAAAARAFEAKQAWQQGFDRIEKDPNLSPEQKDAEKTKLIMRQAPMMGVAGTEAVAMMRDLRPPKPTIPASVKDNGDFVQVTQPNGTVSLHAKPKGGAASTVKVKVSDAPGGILSVPQHRVRALVAGLPQEMADDPVNKAALSVTPMDAYTRTPRGTSPSPSASKADAPVTKLNTPEDVKAAYHAGKLTRDEARKMLKDEFGLRE